MSLFFLLRLTLGVYFGHVTLRHRSKGRAKMAASSKKVFELFVSKVPWTAASKEVRDYFGQFGLVKKCLLPFDKETGFHRGFCWIGFTTEEGLNNALQKDPHVLEGAKLQVQRNRRPFAGQKSSRDAEFD
ncbi:SRA stem-loop-interacting RNA-binding protein, mitochondrial [Oryzias latipes]|uniref:SRA stem-loop interacting RNA binding protein n=2 Tax=Oryzias TaxID=8089 RepID=H2M4X4_ORYLA